MKKEYLLIGSDDNISGSTVDIKGVDLGTFKLNPIIHDYTNHYEAVGTVTTITSNEDSIYIEVDVPQDIIDDIDNQGVNRRLDCGFRVTEKQGNVITKCELIDVSITAK